LPDGGEVSGRIVQQDIHLLEKCVAQAMKFAELSVNIGA
jgi:hypothetical protein